MSDKDSEKRPKEEDKMAAKASLRPTGPTRLVFRDKEKLIKFINFAKGKTENKGWEYMEELMKKHKRAEERE